MVTLEFSTAHKIIFGAGTLSTVAPLVKTMGAKALVVHGNSGARAEPLLPHLDREQIVYALFPVAGEPTTALIDDAIEKTDRDIDVVLGIGGGSVIDAGKAIAAMKTNPGRVLDYLEVIGAGKKIAKTPLPYIAIPTTAGTGAEVTKNAVLLSAEHKVKVSLRHDLLIPHVAVVDPDLTLSMPPAVTANTGLDALTQLIEPFVSNKANPLTDGLCREGIPRVARSLRRAYEDGKNSAAREDMALASLFGGLALANAKLGAVHGFAGPIGGFFHAPHGAICARLLPFVIDANVRALLARAPESPVLHRYAETSRLLTQDQNATMQDGLAWIFSLCKALAVSPLSAYGMDKSDIPVLVEKAKVASSMKGNPIQLTDEELTDILERAL